MTEKQTSTAQKEIVSKKIGRNGKYVKKLDKYGWVTIIEYRSSMDDLVIKQYKEDDKNNRRDIYLMSDDLDELLRIFTVIRK